MTTITIPKKITRGEELIVMPRKDYEEFLSWHKTVKTFKPTVAQKRDLEKARRDFARKRYITLEELKHELESSHSS